MNKHEFMSALGEALSVLPEEERRSVLQYYEDYFLDAEGESDEQIIKGLGEPHKIADDILREYRELQPHAGSHSAGNRSAGSRSVPRPPHPPRWKGVNPWLLAALVLLAIPFGVPLVAGSFGVLVGLIATTGGLLLSVGIVLLVLPATLLFTGVTLLGFSLVQWGTPASAIVTIGLGLICLSLGGLLAILIIKLCKLFLPPLVQGVVSFGRWLAARLRGAPR